MSSLDNASENLGKTSNSRYLEWRWVLIVAGLVLLLSSIPYLVAYQAQTSRSVFNGAVFDRADYAVHLATMQLGARGEWKYHFLFTHEPHPGAYVKLGYIALGQLAGFLRLSLPITYQLTRLIFGFSACLVIYMLFVYAFKEVYWRRMGFLLAILGSGLGWLQLLLGWLPNPGISPIDFWLVDGYVFFSFLVFPHFAAVITMVVGMVVTYLAYIRRGSGMIWVASIVLGICAQAIQPYSPLLGDIAIFGAFAGSSWQRRKLRWRDMGILSAVAISQAPLFVYNNLVFKSNPIWAAFVAQNVTLSPPPVYYLWGFFFFWPFVILGIVRLLMILKARKVDKWVDNLPSLTAAMFWVFGTLVLAYVPSVLQRRFLLGFTIPLGILSMFGMEAALFPWLKRHGPGWIKRRTAIIAMIWVSFSMISTLALSFSTAWITSMQPQELFDSAVLVRAVDWLGAEAIREDVVLSAEATSQLVASRTGLPVYLGHPIETMDYQTKLIQVLDFYRGKIDPEWMYRNGVRWVIWGPNENRLSGLDDFGSGLEKAYQDEDIVIYRLNP